MNSLPSQLRSLPIPILLIASVVLVSVLAWLSEPLRRGLMLIPYRVRHGAQIHRLLTAGWVHVDGSHLAFNMISLYFFAGPCMKALGVVPFLLLYFTSVVIGFVPTTLRYMNRPEYTSVGASGAVAAVMFSAVILNPKMKLFLMFLPIPIPGFIFAIGYLAYSAWHSYTTSDDINHDAHFSGAIYGAALTYVLEPTRVERAIRSLL